MVEHFKRGISYRYFTCLLVVIGIVLPGRSNLLYCLQTWLPNFLYLGFLALKAVLNYSFYEPLLRSIFYGYEAMLLTSDFAFNSNSTIANDNIAINGTVSKLVYDGKISSNATELKDVNDGKLFTVTSCFFVITFIYRFFLFVLLFFKRKLSWDIRRELNVLKHNYQQPDNYKGLVRKCAFLFLLLNFWLYGSLLAIDFFEVIDNENLNDPLWFSSMVIESLGWRLNEAVCTFAVEGFLLYYSLALGYHLEELSETIRLVSIREFTENLQQEMNGAVNMVELGETTTTNEDYGLQPIRKFRHIRLTLSSVHEIFKKCKRFLSPLLAISMLSSVVTLCIVIFFIDISDDDALTQSFPSFLYVILMSVVSFFKIALMCGISDYCHKKVTRAYSHITGLQLTGKSVSQLSQEVALLSVSQKVFSFRFSLGGICTLRKALLPTIAGAVITFGLILSQD